MILIPHGAGMSKEPAIRMAISTARNVLAGIDGRLDPSMVVNKQGAVKGTDPDELAYRTFLANRVERGKR